MFSTVVPANKNGYKEKSGWSNLSEMTVKHAHNFNKMSTMQPERRDTCSTILHCLCANLLVTAAITE